MDELLEIVRMITSGRLKLQRTILEERPDSLLGKFYQGLKEAKYEDDKAAALDLYGVGPEDARYKTLKARLKARLSATVRLLDTPQATITTYREALLRTRQDLHVANIILSMGGRVPGIRLVRQILSIAQRYTITEIEVVCYKILREDSMLKGNFKEYDLLNTQLVHALERLRLEMRAEELDDRLTMPFVNSQSYKPQMRSLALDFIREVGEIRDSCDTQAANYFYYHVRTTAFQICHDYTSSLLTCEEAESYYKRHPEFALPTTLATIATQKTYCCLYIRDYNRGKQYAREALEMLPESNNNWLMGHLPYFVLAMHSNDFGLAFDLFHRLTTNPRFEVGMPPGYVEIWKIFEGYLNYVIKCGWAQLPPAQTKGFSARFKLEKFLNEFRLVSHDKQGTHLAILILQVLWLLETDKYLDLIGLANSLRSYASRHLRGPDFQRANRFVKLILIMIESDFDPVKMRQKGDRYHRALAHPEGDPVNINVDGIEVLPYEKLWERMLDKLEHRKAG